VSAPGLQASEVQEEGFMTLLDITTIVCIGLMIGTEFAVSAFINPVVWKLEQSAQAQAIRMFAAKLGFVMPFWYALGLVLLLIETFTSRHEPSVLLPAIASGIWALVIVLTLVFLVPINNRLARTEMHQWSTATERENRKWDTLHRLRVAALASAMVVFLLSVR